MADKTLSKSETDRFSKLTTLKDIAVFLSMPPKKLSYILYHLPKERRYSEFLLKKKNGEMRPIHIPCPALKLIQRKLNHALQNIFWENYPQRRKYIYGFLNGQHIFDNAACHTEKKYVINVDLKCFFEQITFPRVRGLFLKYPFNLPKEAATVLANIVTFDFHLPQGAPTSPIISNFICARLDGALWKFARQYECFYSRYADDITFSSRKTILPPDLGVLCGDDFQLSSILVKIIEHDNHFQINQNKVRCMSCFNRQEVTGLTVNDKVNVPQKYIKQIRAMLFDWKRTNEKTALFTHLTKWRKKHNNPNTGHTSFPLIVWGKIQYVKQICGEDSAQYRRLKFQYDMVSLIKEPIIASFGKNFLSLGTYIIEDDIKIAQSSGFWLHGVGLITNFHALMDFRELAPHPSIENFLIAYRHHEKQTKLRLKLVYCDKQKDFAILDICDSSQRPGFQYTTDLVKDNQVVHIIGYPNYADETISSSQGHFTTKRQLNGTDYFCVNIPIIYGNSGGPVFNEKLEVIGIATRGGADEENAHDSMNAFIPIYYVIDAIKQINDINK